MIQKQVSPRSKTSDDGLVTVSNGRECFQIPRSDLEAAEADGFYRPVDRGLTIIGDRQHWFEIPVTDVEGAASHGYQDLLARESGRKLISPAKRDPVVAGVSGETKTPQSFPLAEQSTDQPPAAGMDSFAVMDGLSRAEQEAEQARQEQEERLAECKGWRRYLLMAEFWLAAHRTRLLRQLGGNGVSVLIHLALLLILASLFLANEPPKDLMLVSSTSADEVVEEVTFESEPLDVTEPTEDDQSDPTEVEEVAVAVNEAVAAPDFLANVSGDAVQPPAKPAAASTDGMPKAPIKPTIFGSKFTAINYVFVIDNSNSMTKGRFETALHQLMLTVNQLTPKQRFYVIFYSDTAYPMMHPTPVLQLVSATNQNKQALGRWLNTIELCLKTNGKKAIQAAFDLEPDVIYILGDGAFTDGAAKHFVKNPNKSVVVHTRGMQVDKKNAEAFRLLAETHRGTYKDVGVTPEGLMLFQRYQRPRNSSRGPVWGVALPMKKNKKP